jgi:hypothetical protein
MRNMVLCDLWSSRRRGNSRRQPMTRKPRGAAQTATRTNIGHDNSRKHTATCWMSPLLSCSMPRTLEPSCYDAPPSANGADSRRRMGGQIGGDCNNRT